jgi:metallo-beta-lactamase family protein
VHESLRATDTATTAVRRRPARSPVLTFLGAAGSVTGSKFLVESGDDTRVLVAAGLFQGERELRRRNWEPLPLDARTLRGAVLTHAHLDHCGYLPRLVREGFDAPVVCSHGTADLAAIVLRDSAHLQEEDAAYANRGGWSRHDPALPLYDSDDAERAIALLHPVPVRERHFVTDGVHATLHPVGHILGATAVLLEVSGSRVLFSGDLGRPTHPLLPPRSDPPAADVVVVESTYGDRRHPGSSDVLGDALRRTLHRGGTVLVPAFAVDRTELVLHEIGRLIRQGTIPSVPVYVDSPMALSALDLYRRAGAAGPRGDPDFGIPDLRAVHRPEESEALNRPPHPCVIVSASGMATGGRVLHHLAHQLPDRHNCVVLTGYQAQGTRGRALAEGARQVKIHGRYVPVRADVVLDDSFSVHADGGEIVDWLRRLPQAPRIVYVVHGEPSAATSLSQRVTDDLGWTAVVPEYGERVRLD